MKIARGTLILTPWKSSDSTGGKIAPGSKNAPTGKNNRKKQGKNTMLQKLINILYSTDAQGYPLPPHVKIARMQALWESVQAQDKQEKQQSARG